jgi:alpha-galactosidase
MKYKKAAAVLAVLSISLLMSNSYGESAMTAAGSDFARTPPMGWNTSGSYNVGGENEEMVKRGVDAMVSSGLRDAGYTLVLIDYGWYLKSCDLRELKDTNSVSQCDAYGRLIPYRERFPHGFKALSDYIHARGMKFGLHVMRGVYRGATDANLPVKGTAYHVRDIADVQSTCGWSTLMYGLDMRHPGAQAYLDSLFEQYGEWGVDFLKIDDLISPYHAAEIEGYNKARSKAGRPIVISGSPGDNTPLEQGPHLRANMEMFRITKDQWDKWSDVLVQFERAPQWAPFGGGGAWTDLDALPFGMIFDMVKTQKPIACRFTPDEVRTSMTLHCMARSPLVFYADPLRLDAFTKAVLTNADALDADKNGSGQRELSGHADLRKWISTRAGTESRYLALFNLKEEPCRVEQPLGEAGFPKGCKVRDIWENKDLGFCKETLAATIPAHGVAFFRLDPGTRP